MLKDYDIVQNGDQEQELTVTIKLCEYRELIYDLAIYDKESEILKAENKKLREQLASVTKLLLAKEPEIVGKLRALADEFWESTKDAAEEADAQ